MSDIRPVPSPPTSGGVSSWAAEIVDYLHSLEATLSSQNPKPVQLEHVVTGNRASAAVDGLLLYDPVNQGVIVSHNGEWYLLSKTGPITPGV